MKKTFIFTQICYWTGIVGLMLCAPPVFSFSLIEPKPSSTFFSGEAITLKLDIGEVAGIVAVQYFWYSEDEDMLEEFVDEKLALTAQSNAQPPFGGTIRIPRSFIGTYRLLAVAKLEAGQVDTEKWAVFDEILVQIQPKAQLKAIEFKSDKPLRLGRAASARVYDQVDFRGKTFALPVIGRFSDGTVRSIRREDAGTRYEIDNKSVVTISKNGLLRLTGNGTANLKVTNQDQEATLEVRVQVNDQTNTPPLSTPGKLETVYSGEPVVLNGLASYDPEGGSLQYRWSQVRGSKVSLLDPYSGKARFLAPFVHKDRLFRFKLRVTDALGADSVPAYINIIVTP